MFLTRMISDMEITLNVNGIKDLGVFRIPKNHPESAIFL
jgi:hypothetical protein